MRGATVDRAYAQRQLDRAEAELATWQSLVECPSVNQDVDRPWRSAQLQRVIDRWHLESTDWRRQSAWRNLSPSDQQRWTTTYSRYLSLAATDWQRRGTETISRSRRLQAWDRALQLNARAAEIYAFNHDRDPALVALDRQAAWLRQAQATTRSVSRLAAHVEDRARPE